MIVRLLFLSAFMLSACRPLIFAPLSEANGSEAFGERGPHAVETLSRDFRVRVDERVRSDVFFPVDVKNAPLAIVVQGGAVAPERYHWLGEHLASRGMATVLPHHLLDLALFEGANASDVARAVKRASLDDNDVFFDRVSQEPGLVTGHSLGGVVALSAWLNDVESFRHAVALAAIPNPGEDFSKRALQENARVVSVVGSLDGSIGPSEILEGFDEVESGGTLSGVDVLQARVLGMTHYQFTDDPLESELSGEQTPTASLEDARQNALFLLDASAQELIDEAPNAIFDDRASWPEGLEAVSNESEAQ